MPITLEDFPRIQSQRKAIANYLGARAMAYSANFFTDNRDAKEGVIFRIQREDGLMSRALCSPETRAGKAALQAGAGWIKDHLPELAQVMNAAAAEAEVDAAKELTPAAIGILTVANHPPQL